jgi:hypothetical protein
MTLYEIEKCNALGRAVPKAWARLTSGRGPRADSPAWDEQYHVIEEAAKSWHALRRKLNEEVAPWFDGSAFVSEEPFVDLMQALKDKLNEGQQCSSTRTTKDSR